MIRVLLALICVCISYAHYAQPTIPVDLISGSARVSVPIGEIVEGDLAVPIALSYNATGVKPADPESNAGLNWTLIAGGRISREVKGLPDDFFGSTNDSRRGWLAYNGLNGTIGKTVNDYLPTSDYNAGTCTDEANDHSFLQNTLGYIYDSEPDIFTINAPGLNGQFVFNVNKQPQVIPYQDIKIIVNPADLNSGITAFQVLKNDGTRYTFDKTESTIRTIRLDTMVNVVKFAQWTTQYELYRDKSTTFNSSWLLTSIESPGGSKIDFCYGSCSDGNNNFGYSGSSASKKDIKVVSTASTATSKPFYLYSVQDVTQQNEVGLIRSDLITARFSYSNKGLLSLVELFENTYGTSKHFLLFHKIVRYTSGTVQKGRYFLTKIAERNGTCDFFPAYQFAYYGVDLQTGVTGMEFTEEKKRDYWGYFNDQAVSNNPTIYFFASKANAERYRFYTIPGLSPNQTINGANRQVNPTAIITGSLQTITYPTGGTATLEYEPNQYHDAEANTTQYGPGLRTKSVRYQDPIGNSPEIKMDYEYLTSSGSSSGRWVYRSVFGYADVSNFHAFTEDMSPQSYILYERVTSKQAGLGRTVTQFLLPGMYPLTSVSDWTASRIRIARYGGVCQATGNLQFSYYTYPFPDNTNFDFERGLIDRILEYSELDPDVPLQERIFTYNRLSSPKQTLYGIRFERLRNTNLGGSGPGSGDLFVFTKYPIFCNLDKVMVSEQVKVADMVNKTNPLVTTTTYTYSTSHFMLTQMQLINSNGSTFQTRFKYAKDYAGLVNPNPSDTKSVMIKALNDEFMHGSLVQKAEYNNVSGSLVAKNATLLIYGGFKDSLNTRTRVLPAEIRIFNNSSGFSEPTVSPPTGSDQVFTYNANVYRLQSTIDQYDFNGQAVTTSGADKSVSTVQRGYKKSRVVAAFGNARHDEVLYAGFESYTGGEFDNLKVGNSTQAYTGRRSAMITSSTVLQKTKLKRSVHRYYRYSFWAKGENTGTLTLRVLDSVTLVTQATVNYSSADVNRWKYFEGTIDLNTAPPLINVHLSSSTIINIDDVLFYPANASASISSHHPLFGVTSQGNDRGQVTINEYDPLGRIKYVFDQDYNLRQTHDYYYAVEPAKILMSRILASHNTNQVGTGTIVTFNADTQVNCGLANLSYKWYVDNALQSQSQSFQYEFTQARIYQVKLEVYHATLGVAVSELDYDVKQTGTGQMQFTLSVSGGLSYTNCDPNIKQFTMNPTGCYLSSTLITQWFVDKYDGNGWTHYPGFDNNQSMSVDPIVLFNGVSSLGNYSVKCVASALCPSNGEVSGDVKEISISYTHQNPCL